MKDYLQAITIEQVNRGLCLKNLIKHPLPYELVGLAERCERILDSNIDKLRSLLGKLQTRPQDDIRDIYRSLRRSIREIELIEYYGISALYYLTPEIGYLNKLVFRIHREINLPLDPPSVACISTNYYFFQPFTNVIFVPVGEPHFLLHLPDAFHEIGHEVLHNKANEPRLKPVDDSYKAVVKRITSYYNGLLTRKIRETGPPTYPILIAHIHSQWKEYWINEFFCDLFALCMLGPAFAWSHLHLTTEKSDDIYEFEPILPQTHPSDDSRMNLLLMGLTQLGFESEAKSIRSKWDSTPFMTSTQPDTDYQYAYPDDLMKDIAHLILSGLDRSGFSVIRPEALERNDSDSVASLLNKAWRVFWEDPSSFRKWEEEAIRILRLVVER